MHIWLWLPSSEISWNMKIYLYLRTLHYTLNCLIACGSCSVCSFIRGNLLVIWGTNYADRLGGITTAETGTTMSGSMWLK